jgi:hypothetical protein
MKTKLFSCLANRKFLSVQRNGRNPDIAASVLENLKKSTK